eukprot:1180541-Prorocentrum_minimum.AAC.2
MAVAIAMHRAERERCTATLGRTHLATVAATARLAGGSYDITMNASPAKRNSFRANLNGSMSSSRDVSTNVVAAQACHACHA